MIYTPQIHHLDKFLVIHSVSKIVIQGEFNESRAIRAAYILNDHEVRNDRPPVYTYIPRGDHKS